MVEAITDAKMQLLNIYGDLLATPVPDRNKQELIDECRFRVININQMIDTA